MEPRHRPVRKCWQRLRGRPVRWGADGCRGVPGLEHLARALAALRGRGTTQEGDTDAAAGLQMTGPGQERPGGRKVGLALEQ